MLLRCDDAVATTYAGYAGCARYAGCAEAVTVTGPFTSRNKIIKFYNFL